MKKVYYLATCNTCIRIIDELGSLLSDFEKQEIKSKIPEDLKLKTDKTKKDTGKDKKDKKAVQTAKKEDGKYKKIDNLESLNTNDSKFKSTHCY